MQVIYSKTAADQIRSLQKDTQKRILQKMHLWSEQVNPLVFAKKLTDINAYRFRVGDWRIIFETNSNKIIIISVIKRDKAYKNLD